MNRLSPEAVTQLRHALTQWINADAADDAALGNALHAVAAEARERGVRAEELLVMLKTTWFEIGGGPMASPKTGARRLDELVTACIKAYYN
ncbi:MAG TPA: hypothetical protein VM076_14440 [Gemmatimonadaceae bacterium]|nr:hypothetical protein [Gemmatimonadaceae bacterium]